MAVMPRTTSRDPWDLIAQFNQTQNQMAAAEMDDARRLERLPIEEAIAARAERRRAQLNLEMLPAELQARDEFAIRGERRRADLQRDLDVHRTDQNIRQSRETAEGQLRAHEDFYTRNPTFYDVYRRGRVNRKGNPEEDLPDLQEGEGRQVIPSDMTGSMVIDDLKKQYDIVGMPYTYKGKNYVTIKPKGGGPITAREIVQGAPVAGGKGDPLTTPRPRKDQPWQTPPSANEDTLKQVPGVGVSPDGLIGRQSGLLGDVINSFVKAGFSVEGAKALAAEVGRENSYDPDLIFGSHSDPYNRATNVGVFSWQGPRREAVLARLAEEGLLRDGRPIPSQDTLDVMAEFTRDEMGNMNPRLLAYMRGENVDPTVAARGLGRHYIKWRYDDPAYASHHRHRDDWYSRANSLVNRPMVKATADPDIFDVLTEDDMRIV